MSESTPTPEAPSPRRMQLVSERRVADPPAAPAPALAPPAPPPGNQLPPGVSQELIARAAWKKGVMGGLNVAVSILAARFILLVSVGGAIVLAVMALSDAEPLRLAALGIYSVTVCLPLVWLAGRH